MLDGPSLLPGWSRRHVAAHVGYNARAVARLVTWAATGVAHPMYPSPEARGEEIEVGATLNPTALRSLCEHAAIDLDVRWRDLPADRWGHGGHGAGPQRPRRRDDVDAHREVWLHAVDLDVGGRLEDIPAPVLHRLLSDVAGMWEKRGELAGLTLSAEAGRSGRPATYGDADTAATSVAGPLPDLVGWATGRTSPGHTSLEWRRGEPVEAPRWL